MTFTIPNEADAGVAAQAGPDKVDFDILSAGAGQNGVVIGCAVTAQGSPDMTVAVAAGSVIVRELVASVTAGNVTITTANATNPRFDLICVDSAGTKSTVAGTAAASPVFPDPAGKVVLAAVYVPANDTTINANQITDKRVLVVPPRDRRGLSQLSNCIAESFDRCYINTNGALLATGRLNSVAVPVLAGDVITNAAVASASTAFSAPTHSWIALVDSSLKVIRQSTDRLTATLAANTLLSLAMDSVPVTAGARVASSTVTLTFPTLSQALTDLFTAGDSVVVSNANIAAYNGTFTIDTVTSTQITYVSGGSATDSLVAPFPTVQMAAGKRTYTVPANGFVYVSMMFAGTVPTIMCFTPHGGATSFTPVLCGAGASSLTGTCTTPITVTTGATLMPWAGIS
jgi:hypothetical protein